MIRPVTCLCALLAAGSGLYLYQVKHRTLVLDARIADVLRQADVARARTAVLKTEYAMLNQTDRLSDLSGRYLPLHAMLPTQFVQLAGLDAHLPPVQQFPKPGEAPPAPAGGGTDQDAEDAVVATLGELPALTFQATPVAAKPVARAYAASVPKHRDAPALARYAAADRPTLVAKPQAMPLAAPRPVASSVFSTAYLPAARVPAALPYGGSALGAASTSVLAAPVPVAN